MYIPPASSSSPTAAADDDGASTTTDGGYADGGRRPRLGAASDADLDDYFDYDDEYENIDDYVAKDELGGRERSTTIYPEAASDAIDLIRRNVNDGGGYDDEMDEEDMVNAVARALYERGGFRSAAVAASVDVMPSEIDGASPATTTTYSGNGGESTTTRTNNAPSSSSSYAGEKVSEHARVSIIGHIIMMNYPI
jgi:hypothetical protein